MQFVGGIGNVFVYLSDDGDYWLVVYYYLFDNGENMYGCDLHKIKSDEMRHNETSWGAQHNHWTWNTFWCLRVDVHLHARAREFEYSQPRLGRAFFSHLLLLFITLRL